MMQLKLSKDALETNCPMRLESKPIGPLTVQADELHVILNQLRCTTHYHEEIIQSKLPALERSFTALQTEFSRFLASQASLKLMRSIAVGVKSECLQQNEDALIHNKQDVLPSIESIHSTRLKVVSDAQKHASQTSSSSQEELYALRRETIGLRSLVQQLQIEHDNDIIGSSEKANQLQLIRLDLVELHKKAVASVSIIQVSDLQQAIRKIKNDVKNITDEMESKLTSQIHEIAQKSQDDVKFWCEHYDVKASQRNEKLRSQFATFVKSCDFQAYCDVCDLDAKHNKEKSDQTVDLLHSTISLMLSLKRDLSVHLLHRIIYEWKHRQLKRGIAIWKHVVVSWKHKKSCIKERNELVFTIFRRCLRKHLSRAVSKWTLFNSSQRMLELATAKAVHVLVKKLQQSIGMSEGWAFKKWHFIAASGKFELSNSSDNLMLDAAAAFGKLELSNASDDLMLDASAGTELTNASEDLRLGAGVVTALSSASDDLMSDDVATSGVGTELTNASDLLLLAGVGTELSNASDDLISDATSGTQIDAWSPFGAIQSAIRPFGNDNKGAIWMLACELESVKCRDLPKVESICREELIKGLLNAQQLLLETESRLKEATFTLDRDMVEKIESLRIKLLPIEMKLCDHESSSSLTTNRINQLEEKYEGNFQILFDHKECSSERIYELEVGLKRASININTLIRSLEKSNNQVDHLSKKIMESERQQALKDEKYLEKLNDLESRFQAANAAILKNSTHGVALDHNLEGIHDMFSNFDKETSSQLQIISRVLNAPGIRKPSLNSLVNDCMLYEKNAQEKRYVVDINSVSDSGRSLNLPATLSAFAHDFAAWIAYQADQEGILQVIVGKNLDEMVYADDKISAKRRSLLESLKTELDASLEMAHSKAGALRLEARTKFVTRLIEATDTALSKYDQVVISASSRLGRRASNVVGTCLGCDRPLINRGRRSTVVSENDEVDKPASSERDNTSVHNNKSFVMRAGFKMPSSSILRARPTKSFLDNEVDL